MTCEPHVRKEVEEELALERLDAQAEPVAPSAEWPTPAPTIPSSPYPDPAPVVDAEAGTITRRVR